MDSRSSTTGRRRRRSLPLLLALCVAAMAAPAPASGIPGSPGHRAAEAAVGERWLWPLEAFRLERPFVAPAHRYGPGHRGIDIQPVGPIVVRAPAAGTVAFSGPVAGRGILTIDHGDGLVTTLEPVASELSAGASVDRGAGVGSVATGGHAADGSLHFGVRLHGEYINPMLLVGEIPRAVLLPCC